MTPPELVGGVMLAALVLGLIGAVVVMTWRDDWRQGALIVAALVYIIVAVRLLSGALA